MCEIDAYGLRGVVCLTASVCGVRGNDRHFPSLLPHSRPAAGLCPPLTHLGGIVGKSCRSSPPSQALGHGTEPLLPQWQVVSPSLQPGRALPCAFPTRMQCQGLWPVASDPLSPEWPCASCSSPLLTAPAQRSPEGLLNGGRRQASRAQ